MDHEYLMRRVFDLALKGEGFVSPNPLVGALLVKNGEIIGEGYHQKYGEPHAEVNAIRNSKSSVEGATLYCNLEPCCHTDKQTPPCVDLIIDKKIAKVVISNIDPNPKVSGKGVEKLRNYGVEVITGIIEKEGRALNEIFFKYILTSKPFVHLKFAQTMDGKLATYTGDAKWISNEKARGIVHGFRKKYAGILVGLNTLNNDNPRLTARMREVTSPCRVVIGDGSRMNISSHLFTDAFKSQTVVYSTRKCELGVETVYDCTNGSRIDLEKMLFDLGTRKISSILIEGGASVIRQFLQNKLYDKVTVFVAPMIVGGDKSYSQGIEISKLSDAITFENIQTSLIDNQMMVEGYVHGSC